MHENNLLKVALICSIIGIFIIFIFADKLEPSLINISDISYSFIDKGVKVKGYIKSVRQAESVAILDIQDDTGSIKAVVFNEDNFELKKGESVEVLGKVIEFKGSFEIEVNRIISI